MRDLNGQTLFFTASATDMQWRDLYKHMPNAAQYAIASEAERSKLAWHLLQQNPHIATKYLDRC